MPSEQIKIASQDCEEETKTGNQDPTQTNADKHACKHATQIRHRMRVIVYIVICLYREVRVHSWGHVMHASKRAVMKNIRKCVKADGGWVNDEGVMQHDL